MTQIWLGAVVCYYAYRKMTAVKVFVRFLVGKRTKLGEQLPPSPVATLHGSLAKRFGCDGVYLGSFAECANKIIIEK